MKFPIAKCVHFQLRLLSDVNENHVDLADIDARLHFIEIGNGHDFGTGHHRRADNPLAHLRF